MTLLAIKNEERRIVNDKLCNSIIFIRILLDGCESVSSSLFHSLFFTFARSSSSEYSSLYTPTLALSSCRLYTSSDKVLRFSIDVFLPSANCFVSSRPPLNLEKEASTSLFPLFADDILGNNGPPYVRHSKQYKNFYELKQKMQLERIDGFRQFIKEVQSGEFPKKEHIISTPEGLIDDFLKKIG